MKKYSKVYKSESGSNFRYNYDRCTLEWIALVDLDVDDQGNVTEIKLDKPEVVTARGLGLEKWKENPNYWIEQFQYEIDEEYRYILGGI